MLMQSRPSRRSRGILPAWLAKGLESALAKCTHNREKGVLLTRLDGRKDRRDASKFRVEVARVCCAGNLRHKRCGDALVVDVIPVDIPKKRVAHNLLGVGGAGSEAQLGLPREQLLQNGHRVPWHVDRVERLVGQNGVVDFVFVFAAKGRLLEEHLVYEDAKRPPVDRAAILLVE